MKQVPPLDSRRLGKVRHKSAPLLSDGKRLFVTRASKSFEFLWEKIHTSTLQG